MKKLNLTEEQKKTALIWGVGLGVSVLVVGIGAYASKANTYKDKFYGGTSINEISCEGLTVDQVEEKIRTAAEDYRLELKFRNDVTEEIAGADIDYHYVSDGSVQKLMDKQKPGLWLLGLLHKSDHKINVPMEYDPEKLQAQIDGLASLAEDAQIAPIDACVVYENDGFIVQKEDYGTQLDKAQTSEAIAKAVTDGVSSFSAEKEGLYAEPEIKSDNELLAKQKDQLNDLVRFSVTYQLPAEPVVLDGNLAMQWLNKDEEGNYSKDQEAFDAYVANFVGTLAEQVDTLGKERPFHTASGRDVTVKGGNYGWKINQAAELETLKSNIANNEIVTREPEYSSREKYTENNGLGNTYIEVNLSEQHLYYFVNGEITLESDFVSGRMTSSRFTPPGVYFLTYKEKNRDLKGPVGADGQPSYVSHVNYWMPFNGGIGLHDALWRGSFGGNIYNYYGSHGCINLPLSKAAAIYDIIDKETPIVCVYNDGYTLHY